MAFFASVTGVLEKVSVLSLGEAGEWMFRDFKNLLYGSFEASFLSVQAYLMSAMITSEFVVLVNNVFARPFPCHLHNGQVRISVGVPGFGVASVTCFLGVFVNPVLGDVGMCVSRVFKDQVYGAFELLFFNWLFGWWTVATVSDILSFFSKYLYVVVLVHFVKAEFA